MNMHTGTALCSVLYEALRDAGYYPALTGGCLYKAQTRKDLDVLIYRNRQKHKSFEMIDIEAILIRLGFSDFRYYGFVTKCKWGIHDVDLLNPEASQGDY
jgi:hypothetical protein